MLIENFLLFRLFKYGMVFIIGFGMGWKIKEAGEKVEKQDKLFQLEEET